MLNLSTQHYLDGLLNCHKKAFFTLVSEFGSDYIGKYRISNDEIKKISNRQRITSALIQNYINYISSKGFECEEVEDGLEFSLNSQNMISNQEDAINLADAIELFRTRAYLHGDFENM